MCPESGAEVLQMIERLGVMLPLLIVLCSACGDCQRETAPWMLDEPASPTSPQPVPRPDDGAVVPSDTTTCDTNREHVRARGIVDEATLVRRPLGEVVEIWADWGADGVIEACSLKLFDEDAVEVVNVVDHDMEPGPQRVYWMFDHDRDAGRPTGTLADIDADGVWDFESASAFDARGNFVWSTHDEGVDGMIDRRASFFYDDHGHRTRQERDEGDDGVIDGFTDFETDATGRYVQWDEDHDADGRWDRQLTWSYGASQNTFRQLDHALGTREFVTEHLDEQGRTVLIEADRGEDGVIDYVITVEWDGDTAITRHDFDADGSIDNVEQHEWHRAGDELKHGLIHDDFDNDGAWDQIREHVYDEEDRLLHFQSYDPVTGELAFRQTYVRGAPSRRIQSLAK